jgi:hypothetical protein
MMRRKLAESKVTEDDYLLLAGNALGNVMTALTIQNFFKLKTMKMLVYDAKNHVYLPYSWNSRNLQRIVHIKTL